MRDDALDWLALSHCQGLGPIGLRRLLAHFGTPGAVLDATTDHLQQVAHVGPEVAGGIRNADRDWADQQLHACEKHRVDLVTMADDSYPELLREVFSPPPVLYVKGDLGTLSHPSVAIVGARECTSYGSHIARAFGEELARSGVCVVSGLALGIDACAHEGALRTGTTLAVMGTGLDHPYPLTNLALFHRICERGAVVSEFPMGTAADPKHFPRRNQTISGLSSSVLIVEAGPKSGSLITAQYAIEQNRELFAIPGPVTSAKSLGPNHLIQQGASLAQSPDDILADLQGVTRTHTASVKPPELTGIEGKIVACLSQGGGAHVDTIADAVAMPAHEVLTILLGLELSSHVCQLPGKQFALKH